MISMILAHQGPRRKSLHREGETMKPIATALLIGFASICLTALSWHLVPSPAARHSASRLRSCAYDKKQRSTSSYRGAPHRPRPRSRQCLTKTVPSRRQHLLNGAGGASTVPPVSSDQFARQAATIERKHSIRSHTFSGVDKLRSSQSDRQRRGRFSRVAARRANWPTHRTGSQVLD